MYNKISDLRTNPQEYQKPFNPKNKKINNEDLENMLTEYYQRIRGIEISRKRTGNEAVTKDHQILADGVSDFLSGDYLMGIIIEAGSGEHTYSLVVREGKRIVGFVTDYNGILTDGTYFSEKENEILKNYDVFMKPDKINNGLRKEDYVKRLRTTLENVRTGPSRFFK